MTTRHIDTQVSEISPWMGRLSRADRVKVGVVVLSESTSLITASVVRDWLKRMGFEEQHTYVSSALAALASCGDLERCSRGKYKITRQLEQQDWIARRGKCPIDVADLRHNQQPTAKVIREVVVRLARARVLITSRVVSEVLADLDLSQSMSDINGWLGSMYRQGQLDRIQPSTYRWCMPLPKLESGPHDEGVDSVDVVRVDSSSSLQDTVATLERVKALIDGLDLEVFRGVVGFMEEASPSDPVVDEGRDRKIERRARVFVTESFLRDERLLEPPQETLQGLVDCIRERDHYDRLEGVYFRCPHTREAEVLGHVEAGVFKLCAPKMYPTQLRESALGKSAREDMAVSAQLLAELSCELRPNERVIMDYYVFANAPGEELLEHNARAILSARNIEPSRVQIITTIHPFASRCELEHGSN